MKENFSKRVQSIMRYAKEEAIRLGHSYVGSEHLLLGIIKQETGVSHKLFEIYNCDVNGMRSMIEDLIKTSGGTMTLGHLPLTRRAERILRNTYNEATKLNITIADDEHLLLAILREPEGIAYETLNAFKINYEMVRELLEEKKEFKKNKNVSVFAPEKITKQKTPALEHFSRDITCSAKKNELDPIIGRENEIERVAKILTRRKKNNPVLIGEPGVGKTAIIEGLAQRIINKSVPRILHNKRILALDLAAIVAGTKYRGQFEERMKTIMTELENTSDIILFIDELHTLVGAGSAAGSLDASNMFKPALARGDIHCIGATTMDEYRKYVEKDGALERRFQKITVHPPSVKESIAILEGLKTNYEVHHNVTYSQKAIETCVYLSHRYISERFLPDKAIDVMDESGSRAYIRNLTVPKKILDIEVEIDKVMQKKETVVSLQKFEEAAALRDSEQKLHRKLKKAQKKWNEEDEKNPVRITKDMISDVVAQMTGIPINKIAQSESQKLLNMVNELGKKIIAQDEAIYCLTRAIRRARTGLKNPARPIGVFLFLGSTGVGKTELAKVLAEHMFSQKEALVKLDMSEYGERFSVSRLIGAPPGYVGYEEGGKLTEQIRRNPFSVILFDEIEKAHPDIFNLLLQLFDEGVLTDSLGRKIDFKNSIIIMTSNLGTKDLKSNAFGFGNEKNGFNSNKIKEIVLGKMKSTFNPEFINRVDETIVFNPLMKEDAMKIIDIFLKDLIKNLNDIGIEFSITKKAKVTMVDHGFSQEYGARNLYREVQSSLEDPVSEMLLDNELLLGDIIKVDAQKGKIKFTIIQKKTLQKDSNKSLS
ncbi:MAG: ATP-dependent Clp protease ATP-binding subunit [Candidatus Neomarinimicrobiota bacterium]|nr:ATP-dependent Clp protease ATP-binding subunit [Candidatus Neomarinimicrobiota bacterium]